MLHYFTDKNPQPSTTLIVAFDNVCFNGFLQYFLHSLHNFSGIFGLHGSLVVQYADDFLDDSHYVCLYSDQGHFSVSMSLQFTNYCTYLKILRCAFYFL